MIYIKFNENIPNILFFIQVKNVVLKMYFWDFVSP